MTDLTQFERHDILRKIMLEDKSRIGGGVCSYFTAKLSKKSTILTKKYGAPCIQALSHNYSSKETTTNLNGIVIFSNPKCSPKAYRHYIECICTDKSPWRQLITGQIHQSIDDIIQYGYILSNLDFAANYVGNFLIAFRLCEEKPQMGELLLRLMKDGVSLGAALVATTLVFNYKGDNLIPCGPSHVAFEGSRITHDTVERINEGRPYVEKFNQLASSSTYYMPCNVIWGRGGYNYNEYVRFLADSSKPSNIKRTFSDPFQSTSYTYQGLLAFCKALDDKSFKIPLTD